MKDLEKDAYTELFPRPSVIPSSNEFAGKSHTG